jgi:hypothetical protein
MNKKWTILRKKIEEFYFNAKGEKFHFACCDCGLVHDIFVAMKPCGKKISIAFKRNQKMTTYNRNSWKKKPIKM